MSIWGILFFIVLALWLLYEYIVLMGKLYLKYLMVAKLKKELMQAISEVKKQKIKTSKLSKEEMVMKIGYMRFDNKYLPGKWVDKIVQAIIDAQNKKKK